MFTLVKLHCFFMSYGHVLDVGILSNMGEERERMLVLFLLLSLFDLSAMHPNLRVTSSLNLKTTCEATAVMTGIQNILPVCHCCLSRCWESVSTSLVLAYEETNCQSCPTLNRGVRKVRICNITYFQRKCSRKSQIWLLTSVEVLRIKPISFCSGLPHQSFPILVYFILYCYFILSHAWVSCHQ